MSSSTQEIYEQIVEEFGLESPTFVDISLNEIEEQSNLIQRIPVYELENLGRVFLGDLTNEPSQDCNLNLNRIGKSEIKITCPPSSPVSENLNSSIDFNLSGIEEMSFSFLDSSNISNLEELEEVLKNSNEESSAIIQTALVEADAQPAAESETLTVENNGNSGNHENASIRVKKKKRVRSSEEDKENLYARIKSRRKSTFNPVPEIQKSLKMCQLCKKLFKRLDRHRCHTVSNEIVNEIIESSAVESTSVVARPATKSKPLTVSNEGEAKLQVKKKKRADNKENLNVSNMYTRLKKRKPTSRSSIQFDPEMKMCINCKKLFKRLNRHRCKFLM